MWKGRRFQHLNNEKLYKEFYWWNVGFVILIRKGEIRLRYSRPSVGEGKQINLNVIELYTPLYTKSRLKIQIYLRPLRSIGT